MLSIIIPSYKDPLLHPTVANLLANTKGEIEIIVVLDGYELDKPLISDPRVRIVHLGKNRGMRGAINAGVAVARGDFLMRVDEHQVFGLGYDTIMTGSCQPNWIVTARRYFLDPVKWAVMDVPPVDHMSLEVRGGKFSGVARPGDDSQPIQESQAMQGSMWVMPHKWWTDVIGELQTEGYGPHYQDSHEMVFKTWQAGGKLMVNKNTWHAHKHRSFPRTHNNGTAENPANAEQGYAYALQVWKPYYDELKAKGAL
jgi:hypothetical protein